MTPKATKSNQGQFVSGAVAIAALLLVGLRAVTAQEPPPDPGEIIAPFFNPPPEFRGQLGDYRSPLRFADGSPVQTPEQWQKRRQEILAQWHALMGQWPPLITDPKVEVLETTRRDNFQQLKVRFRWTPNELTTGYLLIPDGQGRRPAVVTVFYEPETAIGLSDKPCRDFAYQLARRGFVALSLGTTEATAAKTYALYYPDIDHAQVQPLSMLAYAAANAWYVLAQRPEVDPDRIGIVGHSFGGKWAMFASCLFDRYACAVWSDPGIVFDDRPSVNYWEPWYLGYHPRPWRRRDVITPDNPAHGLYPQLLADGRDLHELHALMAPRPFLVSGGSEDAPRRWIPLNHSIAVNQLLGYSDRVAMTNRPDHSPTEDSNRHIYAFFEHFLKPQ
ncbi:MAG: dienelactone hydrolase family protein [Thermoguttaceae bacterium]